MSTFKKITLVKHLCRVPEDGYYMFTLVVREPGGTNAAGTVLVNGVDVLCRAEQGEHSWQTGTCTVCLRRFGFITIGQPDAFLSDYLTDLKLNSAK